MNKKIAALIMGYGILAAGLTGCVKRVILIDSKPPGAGVWINEHYVGKTPVSHEFITHGRYKFRLEKTGFRELTAREMIKAPVYEWIPFDFFFENLIPTKLEEKHAFQYALVPQPPAELLEPDTGKDPAPWVAQLSDARPALRREAAVALARLRAPSSVPALEKSTHDAESSVRIAAVAAYRAVAGPKAAPRLIEMLAADPDAEVRWQAAAQLEALKERSTVPALIAALNDHSGLVRVGAVEALTAIGDPAAVEPLIKTLADKDTSVRRSSTMGLGKLGDRRAVPGLKTVLFRHDFETRRRAVKSLARLKDPSCTIALVRTFADYDPEVRQNATDALIEFGDRSQAVPLLIRYLRSWQPVTRQHAAIVLGAMKDPRALAPLRRQVVRESNEATRVAMAEAIRQIDASAHST